MTMPDSRFFVVINADGVPVDAGRFDPAYSWGLPSPADLQAGDSLTIYDRTDRLSEYERNTIVEQQKQKDIAALRAKLAELDPPVPEAPAENPDIAF
jgi:hypothetical protein